MQFFSRFILRFAGTIALVGTLLAFAGGYYSVKLFKNLKTDFEELLPTDSRSVLDLDEVRSRLQSIDSLAVLVFSKDPKASKKFIDDLAAELQKEPKDVISSVEYKIDRELAFFQKRQALYIDLPDLIRIRGYIRDRIEYEKELYNPLNIFAEKDIEEPKLDFKELRSKYEKQTSTYSRMPGGYYATPDGTKRAMLIYKAGGGMDLSILVKKTTTDTIARLNPTSYAPDMEIHYTGGIQDQIEEQEALMEDLEISTVIVVVIVAIAMWLFFRNIPATAALLTSLFMGTFWTFGVSYFAVGYLNANSAFMGPIVIGNGINFGIIFLARYLEERRQGRDVELSIRETIIHTTPGTFTAALAAGLSYGSLMLTTFRGFRQFGVIGLIGMVLCWVSAGILLPSYLVLLERIRPLVKPGEKAPTKHLSNALAMLIQRRPAMIWSVAVALSIASVAMFARFTPEILETNVAKLRSKRSFESGSAYYSRYLDEIFQHYLSPLALLPRERADAIKIAEALRKKKAEQGPGSLIHTVQTMDDFVPKDQPQKIKVLQDIKRELPPKLVHRMGADDQKLIGEFLTPEVFKTISLSDMPELVLSKFTERDGTVGKLVLVEPPLVTANWPGDKLIAFIRDLREAGDSVKAGTAVAGTLTITSDMIEAVAHDGPQATLFALIAVMLLVIVVFRDIRTSSQVLISLLLGVLWMAGLILAFNLKINFLNFIALPITFGIGVDYAVNVFQRYREEGGSGIVNVISQTGGAVGLASFTTIVGYMSLLIASNQGFVSFGLLAVAGEITCVVAAVVALPAFLAMREQKKAKQTAEMAPQSS